MAEDLRKLKNRRLAEGVMKKEVEKERSKKEEAEKRLREVDTAIAELSSHKEVRDEGNRLRRGGGKEGRENTFDNEHPPDSFQLLVQLFVVNSEYLKTESRKSTLYSTVLPSIFYLGGIDCSVLHHPAFNSYLGGTDYSVVANRGHRL